MSEIRRKVVVVGGGITGLTAAFYLQQLAQQQKQAIDVLLVESSLRIGGKIDTLRKDGCVIERGPESFFDAEKEIRSLARALHIEDQLIQHNDGKTYIAVGTEMHKIPSSFLLGGSSEVTGLITSSLISLSGKARAAADLFIPKSSEMDESIGAFFRRRFGKEVVENLVEPVLAGTFAGDIDHLSMVAMFPQFAELEQSDRSLIIGLLKNRQGFYNADPTSQSIHYETFENGLMTLIEALEEALDPTTIQKGRKVDSIEKMRDGRLAIYFQDNEVLEVDGVIMTTPFNSTKTMLRDIPMIQSMQSAKAATIGTVTMAFRKQDIQKYKEAINIFVSRNSHFAITSCTFLNRKWNGVCPDNQELLRIYIGRVGDESIVELADIEIVNTILSDLQKMLGLTAVPLFTHVKRWQQGMPQYTIGHNDWVNRLQQELQQEFPTLLLAGSSYKGISMPNCVKQGREAAEQLYNHFF